MGMIPKKTKSETKVFKGLTAQRFLGLFMVIMLSSMAGQLIGGVLQWFFMAFCIVVYFILTGRSPTDPNKNFARGLLAFLAFKVDNKKMIGTSNPEYIEYQREKRDKNAVKKKNKKA